VKTAKTNCKNNINTFSIKLLQLIMIDAKNFAARNIAARVNAAFIRKEKLVLLCKGAQPHLAT
jgi:hypothetical protein